MRKPQLSPPASTALEFGQQSHPFCTSTDGQVEAEAGSESTDSFPSFPPTSLVVFGEVLLAVVHSGLDGITAGLPASRADWKDRVVCVCVRVTIRLQTQAKPETALQGKKSWSRHGGHAHHSR